MYTKKQPVGGLKAGDRVDSIFVVKIKKGISQYKGGLYYFTLLLTDSSGKTIYYKYWGDSNEAAVRGLYDAISAGSVVFLQGKMAEFQGKREIHTNPPQETIKILQKDEYNPDDFIKPPKRNIDEMVAELHNYIKSVQNPEIKKILSRIFMEDREFLEKFKIQPGAIEIHHNWRGGLLQHTLEMAEYCELSKRIFKDLDRDLMIAGVLLHDIGKIEEIEVTSRIKGTRKGQLKGHTAISYRIVANVMDKLNTSEDIRNKILHIILSHLGKMEYGASKEPMFSEAVAVHYADQLSSKITEMIELIRLYREQTEDEFMYDKRKGHRIFLR